MKNMIEVPSEKDFYRTTSIEITVNQNTGLHKVHYRKCNVAMRSVTDFTSCEMEFEVFDSEKQIEYEKEMEYYNKQVQEARKEKPMEMFGFTQPEMPIKIVKITGTIVSYYNTAQRIIVDPFEEFEEKYFNYLQAQRLDLQN